MISDKRAQLTTTLLKEKKKDLLKLAIDSEIKVSRLIEIMTDYFNTMNDEERNKIIAPFNTFPYCEVEGDTIDLYYLKCYTLCKITH